MSRIAYVNGAYVYKSEAAVHIEDRAHQLGDGVYEGVQIYQSTLIDLDAHLDRLWRSMTEIGMQPPMKRAPMCFILKELVRRNHIDNGFLYLQISRGAAPRDHAFPENCAPSMTATCKAISPEKIKDLTQKGVLAISHPDIRWGRCDVKTTGLLPNALAKQAAKQAGAFEAILYDTDGNITEGSSTNIWMVTKEGALQTRSTNDNILPGITRMMVKQLAEKMQYKIIDKPFSVKDAQNAAELFLTSSTAGPIPIVQLDGKKIGSGKVGPVVTALVEAYKNHIRAQVSV